MIIPEKTYTSNPFVDNVIYYAKYLAMNCTIKDEDEALEINEFILKRMKDVVSYDLVEFNPLRDIDRKTEQIALNFLAQVLSYAKNKNKYDNKRPIY